MTEYIDEYIRKNDVYNLKNAFISLIKEESTKHDGIEWVIYNRASESALNMIERGVQEIPAADVVKEVHARWYLEKNVFDDSTWVCSSCFEPWTLIVGTPSENNMNYCPKCGAKMDLEESK